MSNNKNKKKNNNNNNKSKNENKCEKNYYLVDYENVGVKGLEGAENLNNNDYVHMFSTKNAPKITTATLATFNSTNFKVHEVPVKKQSVDMHLVSYLGYLIGTDGPSSNYVIISKDNDYQNIVKYWKKENNITVTYQDNFVLTKSNSNASNTEKKTKSKEKSVNSSTKDSSSTKPSSNKSNNSSKNSSTPTPLSNKELNEKKSIIRNALKELGCTNKIIKEIIQIVSTNYGNKKYLSAIHNELQRNYEDYQVIYDVIKIVFTYSSSTDNINIPLIKGFNASRIFSPGYCRYTENYRVFQESVAEEMKYLGYGKYDIQFAVNNLINFNNKDKDEYFKNLAQIYKENFGNSKYIEVFNIVKAIALGDLNYPGVVSLTYGDGSYFTKSPSPTLEIRKKLIPIYTRLQNNLKGKTYPDTIDKVCDIVLKYYLEDNNIQLIKDKIIKTFGQNEGLSVFNMVILELY